MRYPWPDGKKACISFTMDNMGEAADLHRGIWPTGTPIGSHYSVTEKLPLVLNMLQGASITATYFVEAWNCDHYAKDINRVQKCGHEIGFHAYQHEVWSTLDSATEIHNLDKSVQLARNIGVDYSGFRPPGGLVTDRTLSLMKERGMHYLSPAAARPAVVEGIAILPFQWKYIDAYYYLDSTRPLRIANGDSAHAIPPHILKERLVQQINTTEKEGGYLALLFHPFLLLDDARVDAMKEVVQFLASKRDSIWIAPCKEVARWVLEHANDFGGDPEYDHAKWKNK